ncbi:glycosyltransferase family 2 protein [Mycobacterium sp. URHB0044]|uniref:glycosyltransferase family 2 protein n=1 Tax=Mycobacterium sp. URHB0044 TaxID=1380386 RepID=UPI0006863283|nr:glycosyltransferase [Mycobacterium sp. URHB0044]
MDLDVSVVLPCYTERRLDNIRSALTSLRKQTLEPRRVVVAVDNNPALAELLDEEFDWVTVVQNDGGRGASATRNRGVEAVDTPLTAFLDDDEIADPDWLLELTRPFADEQVVGTGGTYEPAWETTKPRWFPDEFAWVVGGSYLGLPTETAPIRNVWSGNMAVRTAEFRAVSGFRTDFGKQGSVSQPEDTDLCIRMSEATAKRWMYVPSAVILHEVPAGRGSFRFFVTRCFSEGAGKSAMRANLGSSSAVSTEFGYVQTAAVTALRRLTQLRWVAVLQGLTMMLGLASAGAGYLRGRATVTSTDAGSTGASFVGDRKPALVTDFDTSQSVDHFVGRLDGLDQYTYVWILARRGGRPIGIVEACADEREVRDQLNRFVLGLSETSPDGAVHRTGTRADGVVDPGNVTVVICTRERPDDLARAIESLKAQSQSGFRVLVVDNAPTSDVTATVVAEKRDGDLLLDYVVEPTPGLSWARNCALRHVATEFVAWIDDDEVADENWVGEVTRALGSVPDAAAVSGSVVPAELETWAQWWFEQYGGHTKGRGFTGAVFVGTDPEVQNPLYPLPAFGAGANMTFRTSALSAMGGFDVGLGAGTETRGGEDTLMFSQLLLAGHTVVYHPAALTRHFHRRDVGDLEKQMFGYGVGLTAFYTALLRWNWRLALPLIRLTPRAVLDMSGARGSAATTGLPKEFPPGLLRLKRRGLFLGPVSYVRARRRARSEGAVG